MTSPDMADLDELDYGILQLLQTDARGQSPVKMAERLPVTDQTIRNRIENMEESGVIEGYVPLINYEKAEFPIRLQFTCTAPVQKREELANEALEISHVVRVEEMLSAQENIRVLAVTNTSEDINDLAEKLDDLGLAIEREQLMRRAYVRPFNHFGTEFLDEE